MKAHQLQQEIININPVSFGDPPPWVDPLRIMTFPVLRPDSPWVRATLARLNSDQKLAQMLHPHLHSRSSLEELGQLLPDGVEVGGAFLFSGLSADFRRVTTWLQEGSRTPVVVSSDLESGAGRMILDCTSFPDLISLAAAAEGADGGMQHAANMGRATALEGRENGVHWCFGPVVDINAHPQNPITNTRGLGDRPRTIARQSGALIDAMQSHGLAACAKHFPGDGWDDRDQHLCTTVNPLSMEEWEKTSGAMFRAAIDAGVWSIMIGHIALPAWDDGDSDDPRDAPPATLSRKIIQGLLREKLGFQGVIISDALEMAGVATRVGSNEELLVATVNAGCDMLLFCNARRDFPVLQRALRAGRISPARVDEAVCRILALKEALGFARNPASAAPAAPLTTGLRGEFADASRRLARGAVTLVRDGPPVLPLRLGPGDRVLCLHLRSNPEYHVDAFDDLLRAEGCDVVRVTELDRDWNPDAEDWGRFSAILVLWNNGPTWGTNLIRPGGPYLRKLWFLLKCHPACPMVHLNFGNPYLVYDLPWAKTLANIYSPKPESQRAALELLLGRIEAKGKSPVDLARPAAMKAGCYPLTAPTVRPDMK